MLCLLLIHASIIFGRCTLSGITMGCHRIYIGDTFFKRAGESALCSEKKHYLICSRSSLVVTPFFSHTPNRNYRYCSSRRIHSSKREGHRNSYRIFRRFWSHRKSMPIQAIGLH